MLFSRLNVRSMYSNIRIPIISALLVYETYSMSYLVNSRSITASIQRQTNLLFPSYHS